MSHEPTLEERLQDLIEDVGKIGTLKKDGVDDRRDIYVALLQGDLDAALIHLRLYVATIA